MTDATARRWRRTGRRPAQVWLLAGLALVATTRGILSAVAPASPDAPTALFLAIAGVAAVLGLMVWLLDCAWCQQVTLAVGLTSVTTVVALAASGTGAAGASIGYVWLNLYVAFFFSRRVTRGYAIASAASLAVALAVNPFPGALSVGLPLGLTILLVSEGTNRLVHALNQAATTDPLTKLLNRNGLFTTAPQALAHALRAGRPLTVVLIDLDGFKLINDRQGHAAGDTILSSLAAAWQPLLRRSDIVARFGGDEFALVLPDTDAHAAHDLMLRLHRPSPIAWSYGLATARSDQSLSDLLAVADGDLYRAKTLRGTIPTQQRLDDQGRVEVS